MILSDTEITTRLESPLNLLNRLRAITNSNSGKHNLPFCPPAANHKTNIIGFPPTVDEIVEDSQGKIKLSLAHNQALEILSQSMTQLQERLPEVEKAEKLAAIANDMNRIVNNINDARRARAGDDRRVQIVVYAPQIVAEHEFEVIEVRE